MSSPFEPLTFARGPTMKNRFMLAPLTNSQSHADGRLSDDEYEWLRMRAVGGFGLTMTCAAHVLPGGQGFPGQLAIFSDDHLPGLTRLAAALRAAARADFAPSALPVTRDYLRKQYLGPAFIDYMATWPKFVAEV